MTDAQKFKRYFPAWKLCCKANRWHMAGGTVDFDAGRLSPEGIQVMTFARQIALRARRPMQMDDVRHGCHWLALGRDKSSDHLTNSEMDHVIALFKLLANPDDLNARLEWDAYQRGEDPGAVRRVNWVIRSSAPEAYVRTVSAGMCGTRNWEGLPIEQKRVLARALAQRRRSFRRPEPQPAPAVAGDPDWSVE